jgi:hypothetical protein
MQKWYQNKYVQAAGIAFVTGLIAALGVYASTMTDGLDMRHTVKVVLTAFLFPFATLVSVLPKITDILTPTVRLVSQERLSALPATPAPETTLTTHTEDVTVVVDPPAIATPRPEQSSDHVAAAVQRDAGTGRFSRRVIPPVPPIDAVADH